MISTLGSRLVAGTMLAAFASFPVLAQNAPSVAAVPPTREEIQRAAPPPETQRPTRLTVEGGIERAPCPLADPRFAGVTVNLTDVQFDNLRVAPKEMLRPAFADYIGKTVPIAAVCEIRDAAATILRREGYIAAVQVPPQRIENGVVHFDVLMAKLVAVQVRGDAGKSERLIASYLESLKGAEAFNEKEAERYLLLARDLPGFDVRLTLRPAGTIPGEVIGEVTVVKIPFAIDANIQNYGSRSVGRFGGLIRGEAYDILGLGDRLTLGYFATSDFKEQNVVQGGYEFRVGGEGLTVGSRFTYAWTHPDVGAGLKLRSHTLVASGEVSYPFIRRQATNLRGAAGFDFIDQDVDALAGTTLSRDHIRVAFARAQFEAIDHDSLRSTIGYSVSEPKWRLAGALEVRQGLSVFDATRHCDAACAVTLPTPSRVEGDATAFVVRFNGEADYRPVPNLTFALSPSAQYAPHSLLSYEEYSGGNYTVGRGYDPGAIIGDSGVGAQAEIRVGTLVAKKQDSVVFQPYAFVDAVWVWNHDSGFNGDNPQHLLSVGGGVRAAYGNHGRLDLAVAVPLERPYLAQRRGDVRVLLSLTTRLWPW